MVRNLYRVNKLKCQLPINLLFHHNDFLEQFMEKDIKVYHKKYYEVRLDVTY